MKKTTFLLIPLALIAMVGGLLATCAFSGTAQAAPVMTVYKSATCGCCSKWIDHLKANGIQVKAVNVEDLNAIKSKFGVKSELGSCHTGVISGYVVEGHVPAADVKRLLQTRPSVAGIAVPGMPVGSPGMEVEGHSHPYETLSFTKTGKTSVFARH